MEEHALTPLVLLAAVLLGQFDGAAYRRELVPGTELCQFWPTRTLTYTVDAAGYPPAPGASAFAAIDAAFATWQRLSDSCSDLRLSAGPRMAGAPYGYDRTDPAANVNAILFRTVRCDQATTPADSCWGDGTCAAIYRCWAYDDATIAQTTTTFSTRTGAILDADVELNASPHAGAPAFVFTTVDSPPCAPEHQSQACVAVDIQNTLTHEIGHVLGFDHVERDDSTMAPTAPVGETRKRQLDSGTAQGFCDVYPAGLPVPSCQDSQRDRLKVVAYGTTFRGCAAGGSGGPGAVLLLATLGALARRGGRRSRS